LASWNHWPIGLVSVIGFGLIASSASAVSSACRLIGLVGLVGLLTHRPFLDSLATALIAEKNKNITSAQASSSTQSCHGLIKHY